MAQKKLKWLLEELSGFEDPKISLEQYATSPELSLAMMDAIDELTPLDGATVADLGCGCGMLMTTAAFAFSPSYVLGVEIDDDAIATCCENLEHAEVQDVCEVVQLDALAAGKAFGPIFDVVVMNPPFGTKNNAGMDMKFVNAGLSILKPGGSVYSLHKTSTRNFILKAAKNMENVEVDCIAELRWNLPQTYKFHKKKSVDVDVDLVRFKKLKIK
ncbi:unnamed protein product [Caenorhabditis auriculariae]|uniref:Methyltransferase-like protein 5 n=1 Tax=Caenorhabditis auriculariae TaxID=2777116 RepID=A0A8S1GZU2_9PELO|nr:unnamed protein product [Caenorhabditis auriculariae]